MSKFTDGQRKLILGVGISMMVIALVILGISLARGGGFPVTAPLLMISAVIFIVLAGRK